MITIGLTGLIGSGKSTVADIFKNQGAFVIDFDGISRTLTAPGGEAIPKIESFFGSGALKGDGSMDRLFMRNIAFRDPEKRKALECILHPLINRKAEKKIASSKSKIVVLDCPLLLSSSYWMSKCNRILTVYSPYYLRFERVRRRSGLSEDIFKAINASQLSFGKQVDTSDDLIVNVGPIEDLDSSTAFLFSFYSKCATIAGN